MHYMRSMENGQNTSRADAFVRVLKGLLRPLVRALISQGVTAPVFYRLVKQAYVDVAAEDLAKSEDSVTDSRISILTGVHRRDVKAMRTEDQTGDAALRAKVTTLSLVLGRWLAREEFTDDDNQPRPLPRFGNDGATFETLVQSVSRDVRPRTVLDELLRQGLVTLDEDDHVHLVTDAFLGPADLDQRIHFFSTNVGDHLTAAVENLLADEPPFMERAVFYNRLSATSVDTLEKDARALGSDLLLKLNRDANAMQRVDKDDRDANDRFRFGIFFYRETEDDETGET